MAVARKVVFNPNNRAQYYVLYSNGRVNAYGGALDPMATSTPPTLFLNPVDAATDLQVIDWTNPKGYILDFFGQVHPWGNSPPTAPVPQGANTNPFGICGAFAMNPAGNGQGYYSRIDGFIEPFGGAPVVEAGPTLVATGARAFKMEWSTKKYYVMDGYGGIHARQGAAAMTSGPYWPGWDIARSLEVVNWVSPGGYVMDGYGGIHALGSADEITAGVYWGVDVARDFRIIDDGTDPAFALKSAQLNQNGGVTIRLSSAEPAVILSSLEPASPTTLTTRPRVLFSYRDPENDQMIESQLAVFTQATADGLVNEVQRLTMTGTPTGGTFALHFGGYDTAPIARNATAAAVQAALETLWQVTVGDIVCTGGPLPAAVTLTFAANLGRAGQPLVRPVKVALTGGTSPTITATQITAGTPLFSTLVLSTALWHELSTDDPGRRQFVPPVDLPNGTLRAFMRVRDSSLKRSATYSRGWTQNVVLPATPTVALFDRRGLAGVAVTPSFSSFPAGAQFVIEFSDDYQAFAPSDATWAELRYATADEIGDPTVSGATWRSLDVTWRDLGVTWRASASGAGFGANTRVDYESRFGRARWYRCRQYQSSPYLSSLSSVPVMATLTGGMWALTDPFDASRALVVSVAPPHEWSREAATNIVQPAGSKYPVVETIGPLRAPMFNLKLWLHNEFDYTILETMLEPGTPLLLRDPMGRGEYIKLVGQAAWSMPQAQPSVYDQARGFPVRHFHEVSGTFASVRRPLVTLPDPFVVLPG